MIRIQTNGAADPQAYGRAALNNECNLVATAGNNRNAQLNKSGFALGQLVADGKLDRQEVERRLLDASAASGYVNKDGPAAARATLKSGLDNGARSPRATSGSSGSSQDNVRIQKPAPRLSGVPVPNWTTPGQDGRPKFLNSGKVEPPRFDDDARRHLYMRDGEAVRGKVKKATGGFTDWYRVKRSSDGAIGWQAKKPEGYVPVPYLPVGAPSPFTAERVGEVLVWCEGEKDADTFRRHDLDAFTFGGSSDVPDCDDLVRGRHLIIADDNDDAGRACTAKKVAVATRAAAASIKIVTFSELDVGGDATDFFDRGGTVKQFLDRAKPADADMAKTQNGLGLKVAGSNTADDGKEEVSLLNDGGVMMPKLRDRLEIALQPEAAGTFPIAALPPLMAEMAQAMVEHIQAPEALCAHSVLSAAALTCQGLADICLPSTTRAMPLSLFLLVVAASGERKSTCDGFALKAIATLEDQLIEQYGSEFAKYRAAMGAFEGEVAKIKANRKLDLEERERLLLALQEPLEPKAPVIRVEEPTLEGLVNLMIRGRPSLGIFSAEGGSFLGGHGMSDDARTRTITGLSRIYDNGSAQRIRAKETSSVTGRRVSISLATQAKIAATLLGDELAQDQGFLGRFLTCYPESRIGTRTVRLARTGNDPRVDRFGQRVERLMALQDGAEGPLQLPVLGLSDEAWELFRSFSQAIEDNLGEGRRWHPIRATAQRMSENIGRIAGVLHIFEIGDTNQLVSGDTMAAACEVGGFYLREALRLSGGVMMDAETQATQDLATWLESLPGDLISPTLIQRLAPNSLRLKASETREKLRALVGAGRLEPIGEETIDGKRYREVYKIHRGVA